MNTFISNLRMPKLWESMYKQYTFFLGLFAKYCTFMKNEVNIGIYSSNNGDFPKFGKKMGL